MKREEAVALAAKFNKHPNTYARVVRILPKDADPPQPGDKGWDVEVRVMGHEFRSKS